MTISEKIIGQIYFDHTIVLPTETAARYLFKDKVYSKILHGVWKIVYQNVNNRAYIQIHQHFKNEHAR